MEEHLQLLFLLSRLRIRWDPPPPWFNITREEMEKLREVHEHFEKRLVELETEMYAEFSKAMGAGKITGPEKVIGPEKMADMPVK